jgi:hypothetical protein
VPFTLRNLREDLEDLGSRFDGAPDLEFRLATDALEVEKSGLSYQRVPPGYRFPYRFSASHERNGDASIVPTSSQRATGLPYRSVGVPRRRSKKPRQAVRRRIDSAPDAPRAPRLSCGEYGREESA